MHFILYHSEFWNKRKNFYSSIINCVDDVPVCSIFCSLNSLIQRGWGGGGGIQPIPYCFLCNNRTTEVIFGGWTGRGVFMGVT